MGRKAVGTVRLLQGAHGKPQWHARYTLLSGDRTEWEPLDANIAPDDEAGAKMLAARMAPKVRAARANKGAGETVEAYANRWCTWREKRGLGCVGGDRTDPRPAHPPDARAPQRA